MVENGYTVYVVERDLQNVYESHNRLCKLFFTIVDIGETIPYNVIKYHEECKLPIPEKFLPWAVASGNSTLAIKSPRGIGLTLIKDFVEKNRGEFYIVSEKETFEISNGKSRLKQLDYPFPGTIVTIGFNLHDKATYFLKSDMCDSIQF